jgi:hypothetical protein
LPGRKAAILFLSNNANPNQRHRNGNMKNSKDPAAWYQSQGLAPELVEAPPYSLPGSVFVLPGIEAS